MKIKIILPIVAFLSVLILGCKRDVALPKLNTDGDHLRSMPFNIEASLSNNVSTRGFPLKIEGSYSSNGKINYNTDIMFSEGNWDNGHNKPRVIFVVRYEDPDNNISRIIWAKELDSSSYEYKKAKPTPPGLMRNDSKMSFSEQIKYDPNLPLDKQSVYMYVFDNDLGYTFNISDNNGRKNYDVKINFPSLDKDSDGKSYILTTADVSTPKLIFRGSQSISFLKRFQSGQLPGGIINSFKKHGFYLKPMGTLLLFDLRNVDTNPYKVENKYLIRIKTNGFSFENVVFDCKNDLVSHRSIYPYTKLDDRTTYSYKDYNIEGDNLIPGDIKKPVDYMDVKLINPNNSPTVSIPGKLDNNYSHSNVYALYVMVTYPGLINGIYKKNAFRISHPYGLNNENYLYYRDNLYYFGDKDGTSISVTLDVPSGPGHIVNINDFIYAGDIPNIYDSGSGSWSDGNTDNFDNAGNLPSNQSLN